MGSKKPATQVVYIPTQYQGAPPQSTDQTAFNASADARLAAMQKQYEDQLSQIKGQYATNADSSKSMIQTLQESLARQQQQADTQRATLEQSNQATQSQLALLTATRDAQLARYQDSAGMNTGNANSMYGRLQRRRQARSVNY